MIAPDAPLAGLARLTWMAIGNIALVVLALGIAVRPPWTFTWRDAAFAAALVGVLAVRYFDVTRLGGRTADGDPATMGDYRRWALGLVAIGGVAWTLGQMFAL